MDTKHTLGYEVTENGDVFSVISNWRGYGRRPLVQDLNSHGYPSVRIYRDGRRVRICVHVLMARAFLPTRPTQKHEVRHLNGIPTDNRISNLAWGTKADNAADRERHGRTSRGAKHSAAIKRGLGVEL